ncbi:MAG: response regulator [Betaproteobacteria bacterium]|nr:response regulator [Betaproteobacteria bacterium]
MATRLKALRYGPPVLIGFFALIALVMAALLGFELVQRQALKEQGSKQLAFFLAPAFLLDREFLRLTNSLEGYLESRPSHPADELNMRLEIFLSKLALSRESPGSALMREDPQVAQSLQQLQSYGERAERALSGTAPDLPALQNLLKDMRDFTAESLAMANNTDIVSEKLVETQTSELLNNNLQILWLTGGQLLLLLILAWGLVRRGRIKKREEQALLTTNAALLAARESADRANLSKSIFLANMSHELRTPFNGVMGLLSLLSKTPLTAEQADMVQAANDSARHLSRLLNDTLDLSSLEAGNITFTLEPVQLAVFLRSIEATFRPLAAQKNLQFEITSAIPADVWIETDSTRLRQILFNLLHNAFKFTQQGRIALVVRRLEDAHQQWLELDVEDSGIGMNQEALDQLFQRFFQVDSGLSRKFSGAGLGLHISMALARRFKGDITVQSQVGAGTLFTVRLPLKIVEAPAPNPMVAVASVAVPELAHGIRILVAEDHPVNQKFISLLLQRLGHKATLCENGEAALEAFRTDDYELVLMDIHMPVMDGLTATRAIRALPAPRSQVPIIALTADVLQEARDQAKAAGVDAFITKPVTQEDLELAMAAALARAKAPELQVAN